MAAKADKAATRAARAAYAANEARAGHAAHHQAVEHGPAEPSRALPSSFTSSLSPKGPQT